MHPFQKGRGEFRKEEVTGSRKGFYKIRGQGGFRMATVSQPEDKELQDSTLQNEKELLTGI
jgi:hypothetical protein